MKCSHFESPENKSSALPDVKFVVTKSDTMAARILTGPEQQLQNVSFGKVIFQGLQIGCNRTAMVDVLTGESVTYTELLERSASVAQHLKRWGLGKHDTISVSSENTLYSTIPTIAAFYLGVTIAPLNHFYTERELIHAMNISKPMVVFCNSSILDKILKVSEKLGFVQRVVVLNRMSEVPEGVQRMEEMFSLPLADFQPEQLDQEHTAAILCSSGTTGLPKGVMLTHRGFNASHHFVKDENFGNYDSNKIALVFLPTYHAFGFITHLCMLVSHMRVVMLARFEEKLFLSAIQQHRISYIALVPPLLLFLAKHPIVDNYDLSSLQEFVSGAAPLGKDLQDAVMNRLGVIVRQGYGMTEMTLATALQPYDVARSGSVGKLVPGMQCKVIDIQSSAILGPNQHGELCFKGTQIMKGYAGDPAATAATVDAEGWLHTGDIGYYDAEEFLYIVDRHKELIKYKGFQVPPAELEGLLLSHEEVLDAAVVGLTEPQAGELPLAFIVRKPKSNITETEIQDFVAKNVSYHKRLHGGVRFVPSIPKSPTGKIMRRLLRDQLAKSHSKL